MILPSPTHAVLPVGAQRGFHSAICAGSDSMPCMLDRNKISCGSRWLRHILKIVAVVFLLFLAAIPASYGFTANDANKVISSNGSISDTQAAVTYVAAKNADGWVLTVGSAGGSYTWTSTLTISIPHVFTIQGASPSNRPTITSTYTGSTGISLGCTDGKAITVKDLKFNGWTASNTLFGVNGSGVDCFRLTNLEFTGTPRWCIWVGSTGGSGKGPYGLIDHCTMPNGGYFCYIRDNLLANPNSWHRNMTWGTREAVYIENCVFSGPLTSNPSGNVAGDGDNGCRVVFRHNVVTNFQISFHGADTAGTVNSCLQLELMHNTWTVTNGLALDTVYYMRGGSAAVFDNTINRTGSGFYNYVVKMVYQRADGGNQYVTVDRFYPQDYLGTQQPGMGVHVGSPSKDPRYPNEPWSAEPVYIWGNHINVPLGFGEVGSSSAFMQLNRDYFRGTPKPGYTEFTYPHPLQATPSAPSPPSNLRVTSGP